MAATGSLAAPEVSLDVARRAVQWLLELQATDAPRSMRQDIEQWCSQHPEHQRAWQHIEQLDGQFDLLATPRHAELAQKALTAPGVSRRNALKTLSLLLCAGGTAYWTLENGALDRWQADYRTATGEQRTITLDDGTQITLNSGSALEVDYTPQHRRVALLEGEIYIRTGKGTGSAENSTARPFIVDTDQGRMQPLGTRFAVRLQDDQCRLAVYHGQVELTPRSGNDSGIIAAGQSTLFTADGWSPVAPVDEQEAAWTEGMIVVSGMPLQQFVAELSRYRPGILRVDPAIATLTVSGTYPITQTDQVLQALVSALPIRINTLTRYWVTLIPA